MLRLSILQYGILLHLLTIMLLRNWLYGELLPLIIILIWFAFRTPTVEKVLAFKISFIALLADFYAEKLAVIITNDAPYEICAMTRVSSLIIGVGIILLLISKFSKNVPKEVYYLLFF